MQEFKESLKRLLLPKTPSEIELYKREMREKYEKYVFYCDTSLQHPQALT